jgi:choline kinase/mannose-6-phosphate isomerase-like protein (cupin superfamily)/thiamine kinase-like enzyme
MQKTVYKPWGREEWLELNEFYCYKRIYINEGYKTSYQYHEFKIETNYIISGTAEVWLENDEGVVEKKIMKAGEFFNVTPPKKHRVIALTDIILQEVSTPHVDDVIRLEDDTNRQDGKISGEHKTPAVLILAAGKGSRLGNLTTNVNKALLPVNNKAVISHIIEKFPSHLEIVVALGYQGDSLESYCRLAHPDKNISFVKVDNIDGEGSGPGYSALQCKSLLQRPFYMVVADCLIDSTMPHLDGNWLGIYPTSYPEKYSTVDTSEHGDVLDFTNKNEQGYHNAFIGLAGIWDYEIFWKELETNILNGEIVSAFNFPKMYPSFKAKKLKWLDTGNLDDFDRAKEYFKDTPISLMKITGEITYKVSDKFIKFNPEMHSVINKAKRAEFLGSLIPRNFDHLSNFIHYAWENGNTLYSSDSYEIYIKFLSFFDNVLTTSDRITIEEDVFKSFYVDKTLQRKNLFIDRFGDEMETSEHVINGKLHVSLNEILKNIDIKKLFNDPCYEKFHGDLQFDNILYDSKTEKFTYIDWRESFGGEIRCGDIYYDLAKLYGGCIIPYNLAKDDQFFQYTEGVSFVNYSYKIPEALQKFTVSYEKWLIANGYDLDKVKMITGLIFLNMSPLHSDIFGKLLWFKSIEILSDVNRH